MYKYFTSGQTITILFLKLFTVAPSVITISALYVPGANVAASTVMNVPSKAVVAMPFTPFIVKFIVHNGHGVLLVLMTRPRNIIPENPVVFIGISLALSVMK